MQIQIAKVGDANRYDNDNHKNWHTIASGKDALEELIDWLNDSSSDAPHPDTLITDLMGDDYKFTIDDWWFRTK